MKRCEEKIRERRAYACPHCGGWHPALQGLVPDPAHLRTAGALVRQDLATRRDPTRPLNAALLLRTSGLGIVALLL
jgi:hypothetical protein